jgi:hypothetical protein
MTSTATIAAIWSALGNKLLAAKVTTTGSAFARSATNLYVIDKIGFSHKDI